MVKVNKVLLLIAIINILLMCFLLTKNAKIKKQYDNFVQRIQIIDEVEV